MTEEVASHTTARTFTKKQKRALYLFYDGKCAICGKVLGEHWHADHIMPWSDGGKTVIENGQPLCQKCNLKKGDEYDEVESQ